MAQLDSPESGGSPGSVDDGDGGGGGGSGGGTLGVINTIRAGNLRAFLLFFLGASTVNMLVGEEGLLTSPRQFIITVIEDWLFNSLIRPIAESVWNAGVAAIDALAVAFFGNDYAIGHPGTTQVGVLDIPFLITGPLGVSSRGLGTVLSEAISSFNEPIVNAATSLGIAAPIIAPFTITVLYVTEIATVAWLLWFVISSIDIPYVKVMDGLRAALTPVTNFLGWLLE